MAKSKNNNGLYIGICVAVVAVIAIVVGVIMMNKNKGDDGTSESGDKGGTQNSSVVEYNSVDETITLGDYEAMQKLSKAIQNGEMVGKIVKVHGLVSHPMSTYSVVQENEDGTKKIGTEFVIAGAEDGDYPKDGDTIVITGEVVEKSPMYFVIQTTKNNLEVQ